MLADDCVDGQVQLLSESPLTTRLQLGSLQLDVRQELEPVALGGSTLRQTYTLTNTGSSDIATHLVRHLDGDLRFDANTDDGAAASGPDGHTLTEFDSVLDRRPASAAPDHGRARKRPDAGRVDDPALRLPTR